MKLKTFMNESSLTRLWKHMQEHDAGTITSYRSEEIDDDGNVIKTYTKKENQGRNKILLSKLRSKYSITKVKGAYIENYGSPRANEVGESVFFVVDNQERGNLEKVLRKLGQSFNQDSILFIPKGTNKGILWGTKKDEFSDKDSYPPFGQKQVFTKAVWGKEGEFMTKISGRPFLFTESVQEIPKRGGYGGNLSIHLMSKLSADDWRKVI
jgi:hypothetical protein